MSRTDYHTGLQQRQFYSLLFLNRPVGTIFQFLNDYEMQPLSGENETDGIFEVF